MVERGLVRRRAHPTHGKILEMSVTAAGVEPALQGGGVLEPCERGALRAFLPEEQEQGREHLHRMPGTLSPRALGAAGPPDETHGA
ncbi:hypothetical protein ABT215_31030 [Streptomyces sp900105755]|uniref:hypothetical protein n=1 Tax=Streptomyces sp. 900105755 TaxID=3154389 RepID=UPI00332D4C91